MTINEYIEQKYPTMKHDIIDRGISEHFQLILFPFGKQCTDRTSVDYLPFEYDSQTSIGGSFASDVSTYIYDNFHDCDLNENCIRYINPNDLDYNVIPSSLRTKMYSIMRRYKYKWHALYETMQVDSQYDMLDNVNEIFDETTVRTPDLSFVENGTAIYGNHETTQETIYGNHETTQETNYGNHETTQENVYGGMVKENENVYGATSSTKQIVNGQRTDNTSQTIGALSVDTSTSETRGNDTVSQEKKKIPFDLTNAKTTDIDTTTNTYGAKAVTSTSDTSAQNNSSTNTIGSQTNVENDNMSTHTDTFSEATNSHTDNLTNVSKTHTDSLTNLSKTHTDNLTNLSKTHTDTNSVIKNETGEEETVITRHRHGNIGVTTSGQLIADYRKTHYFDLIKVIGDDIANEILSMVWG